MELIKIKILSTGSHGNAYILHYEDGTKIQLDCGVIDKEETLNCCVISHSHGDHNKYEKKLKCKVLKDGEWIEKENYSIQQYEIDHKVKNHMAIITTEKSKLAYITDCGNSECVIKNRRLLKDLDFLMIECNHDWFTMANRKSLDYHDIYALSEIGHLSNVDTLNILAKCGIKEKTKILFIHKSRSNSSENMFKVFECLPNKWQIAKDNMTVFAKTWKAVG